MTERQDIPTHERQTATTAWDFFLCFGVVATCGLVAAASFLVCDWIWAWGEKPWYSVPGWVHDFGWLIALALAMLGVVAAIMSVALSIRAFYELLGTLQMRRLDHDTQTGLRGCGSCLLTLLLLAVVLALGNSIYCSMDDARHTSKKESVSASQIGESWPLTVSEGKIFRRSFNHGQIAVVFVAPDGTEYGLNGTAQQNGYRDIHLITQRDPRNPELYKDVFDLIQRGLLLE
jgi:hypothetical protein